MSIFYFRSKGGRAVAILMAVIMALTIYSGVGLSGSTGYAAADTAMQESSTSETDKTVATEASQEDVTAPAVPAQAEKAAKNSEKAAPKAKVSAVDNDLVIKSVEVLTRGDVQNLYRDTVYKGDATKGEDPGKWYTTYREFNLKDPRIFNLEFAVPTTSVGGDTTAYLDSVTLNYGGVSIDEWGNGNELRGSTKIFVLSNKAVVDNGDGTSTVSMSLESKSPYATTNQGTNVPFNGYYAGTQSSFIPSGGSSQSGDNRAYWKAGPVYKGMGAYELAAMVDGTAAAATDVHIGPYDEMYSWIEMNEYSQSIIKAITGSQIPIETLNEKPIGTLAKGYVALDDEGNFVKGKRSTDVYVEVSIIGYGLTDNYKEENKDFNNYSRFNPQWNVVVSYDEDTVDTYLNETVPTMNNDPQKLIDKYKNKDPEDIDMVNVYYQNNVHSDEVTGTDSSMKLIIDLIDGGKAGKEIPYKTMDYDDMDLRYRVPTSGYTQNASSHTVKGTYTPTGTFMDPDSRKDAAFDTGEALDKLIFVTTLCSNPDGKAGMRRVNRYGLDMNRDVVFATQPETISLTKDIAKWDPLLMNEWHGYVTQMLIEPCTAPHDPTFEYDLLQNNMLQLAYKSGLAITGSTGYADFRVPWDHLAGGAWDDGGTIYAPMFAMLLGTYGYTVEFPHSNSDSFEAGNVLNYAMVNELLTGKTKFFEGNALNGKLPDLDGKMRDSHEVDNKYTSMRKSSVLNKLEVKLRGIENIDSMDADKYFVDNRGSGEVVVGRPRPVDDEGKTLSYFPDYLVIPTDTDNQYNVAESIKGINHMIRLGAKVSVATDDIKYNGKTIPKGAYVFDMKQGSRNLIFEIMGKGYDATNFPSMYADIYCNYPDVRGFDSIQVYGKGLYNGKLKALDGEILKKADIAGTPEDYVVFKSQSTDAVRFVNLLLSGRSSGPSTAEKGDVWMLRKDVKDTGKASDYVISAKDLSKINKLVDNPDLGLIGCHIEGKYISNLPKEAVKLVEPKIQFNTARTAQSGGVLWWALDDYLGFASMADYNGGTTLRSGANVVVSNNAASSSAIINAVKEQKLGLVMIQNASILTDANFGTGTSSPSTGTLSDVALNGEYNIDDSLFTANYEDTTTMYARGTYYTGNLPTGSKTLFKSLPGGKDAFIGGWQNTGGAKTTFGNRTMIFSTILKGGGITGKPVQSLTIGQNMHNRSHYQKLLPMLATGIYAGAAGILDDFNNPTVNDMERDGSTFMVTAKEPNSGVIESGVEKLAAYRWNGSKFGLTAELDAAATEIKLKAKADIESDQAFKVVATDYAGNEDVKYFLYTSEDGKTVQVDKEDILKLGDCKVTVEATEGGDVTGAGTYKAGTVVQVSAKADKGYEFLGWFDKDTGARLSFSSNHSITVKGDMNIIAKFEKTEIVEATKYTVGVTATTGGKATGGGTYKGGETAQLSAKANKGYEFLDWLDKDTGASLSFSPNYSFAVKGDITIVARFARDVAGITVAPVKAQIYDGKAKTPTLTVKDGSDALKAGTDYTAAYTQNKKIGKATVKITGKGNYIGTKTVTFKIVPKTTSVKSTKVAKKKMTIKWNKVPGSVTKYQVSYKVKGAKTWKTKTVSAKNASLTIKKLKKGKSYQVRVRSYKTVDKAKYYSAWSKVKTTKKIK